MLRGKMIRKNTLAMGLIFTWCSIGITPVFAQLSLSGCNKLAVYELSQCLGKHGSNDSQHCWTDSHLAYQECHFRMSNHSRRDELTKPVTKAELKKIQRLSKKVRAKTIKTRLMGAANLDVYQQVLDQSIENYAQLLTLNGTDKKQRKQARAKQTFYRQLHTLVSLQVSQQISCTDIKQRMSEFSQQHQSEYSRSAYREIKALLPIYCRLISP